MNLDEQLKQIKGFDDYMIGDQGTLLSRRRGCGGLCLTLIKMAGI